MSPKNADPIYPIVKEIIVLQQSGSLKMGSSIMIIMNIHISIF